MCFILMLFYSHRKLQRSSTRSREESGASSSTYTHKKEFLRHFYILLTTNSQNIEISIMISLLPFHCLPSSPSHSETVVTLMSIHSGLNISSFVHTYTNIPIHTTHIRLQLTLGRQYHAWLHKSDLVWDLDHTLHHTELFSKNEKQFEF